MARPRQPKRQKRVREELIEVEENENGNENAIFIPCSNDSRSSDSCSESDTESEDLSSGIKNIPKISYRQVRNNYEENQKKLASNHEYKWVIGENEYHDIPKNNTLLRRIFI